MKILRPRYASLLALVLFLPGCSGAISGPDLRNELETNRNRWQSVGFADYTYRVDRACFCGFAGLAEIEVRNSVIVAVTQVHDGSAVEPEFFQFYDTVEDLFDLIEDAIAREPQVLNVEYDAQLGYPTSIELDYAFNVADDELTVTVSGLMGAS
jgi:hypothetical protein